MSTEFRNDYAYNRPVRRKPSYAPMVFMVLLLPLFFLFGFVANELNEPTQNGLEVGIGGGPEVSPTIKAPTPDNMMNSQTTSSDSTASADAEDIE